MRVTASRKRLVVHACVNTSCCNHFTMGKKWSIDLVTKLLELYEQYPCLWNHKITSYQNRYEKERALTEIVEVMSQCVEDVDIATIKAKLRTIRGAYNHERVKILKSTKNEDGKIYVPTTPWYPIADRFLKDIVFTRDIILDSSRETNELNETSQQSETSETNKPIEKKHEINRHHNINVMHDNKLPKVLLTLPKSLFQKPHTPSATMIEQYTTFGDNVAATLRCCNRSQKEIAMAQYRINEALFHLQMGHYTAEVEISTSSPNVEISSSPSNVEVSSAVPDVEISSAPSDDFLLLG